MRKTRRVSTILFFITTTRWYLERHLLQCLFCLHYDYVDATFAHTFKVLNWLLAYHKVRFILFGWDFTQFYCCSHCEQWI